jgi:ATP synthase F0 subunit c
MATTRNTRKKCPFKKRQLKFSISGRPDCPVNHSLIGGPTAGDKPKEVTNKMDPEAAKLIGAGLAMIGTIGAGAGIGVVVNGAVQGIARNPDASGVVQTNMILGIAFAEAVAIYCLVIALLILFVF